VGRAVAARAAPRLRDASPQSRRRSARRPAAARPRGHHHDDDLHSRRARTAEAAARAASPARLTARASFGVVRTMGNDYGERMRSERRFFDSLTAENELPEIYNYWSNRYLRPKLEAFGFTHPEAMFGHYFGLAYRARKSGTRRFMSIGTGECTSEIALARHLVDRGHDEFVIECMDINPGLLATAASMASESGVGAHIVPVETDINKWKPAVEYDGVLANSSLHHIVNLEGLFEGIEQSLAPTGTFVTSDMIGRNGHMRWPEALAIVHEFWRELPKEKTYNHLLRRHEKM